MGGYVKHPTYVAFSVKDTVTTLLTQLIEKKIRILI